MDFPTADPLDEAGAALSALGEDVVLLAYYRGGADFPEDRYSVRLTLDGVPNGLQESAATASAALAKARVSRARRRRSLEADAALRSELARRAAAGDR